MAAVVVGTGVDIAAAPKAEAKSIAAPVAVVAAAVVGVMAHVVVVAGRRGWIRAVHTAEKNMAAEDTVVATMKHPLVDMAQTLALALLVAGDVYRCETIVTAAASRAIVAHWHTE